MDKGSKQIELRSEKVRNIIGQVPPILLHYGIMIIGGALLVLVGVSAFIPYQPSINVEIVVTQSDNETLHYSTRIPQSAVNKREKFNEVILNSSLELPLPTQFEIMDISNIVEISEKNAWCSARLRPIENTSISILLETPIILQGKILLEKQSVMMWIIEKF